MMSGSVDAVYWHAARYEIARVLSWQDREPCSQTYGCFDRNYWGWKFTDFPGARFQEGVCTLAYLWTTPLADNPFYQAPHVRHWLQAGLRFWQRLQYRNGSFDEAYPFEHSLAATAFTSFYIGLAVWRIRESWPEHRAVVPALARAGDWLCRNDERHGVLSNHLAAAAAALYGIFRLTGEARFERRCWHFVQRIYDHQSAEGWYEEYGGADPGYQTHGTFYLAWLWHHTRDAMLQASLERSVVFLKHFIHPNGTLGGEYGSRNTEFYFPAGFEILAAAIPDAARIAHFMRPWVTAHTMAGLWTMDLYNMFPMLNNYLLATDYAAPSSAAPEAALPCHTCGEWCFADAGLLVQSTPTLYMVVSLAKGGVLKVYDKRRGALAVSDCGYWARLGTGSIVSSQMLHRQPHWQRVDDTLTIETHFVPLNQRLPTSWLFLLFRLFSLTCGRVPQFAAWLKDRLVHILVRPRPAVPLRLRRQVHLHTDTVTLTDEITITGTVRVAALKHGHKFAAIHMGSSRYFQAQELEPEPEPEMDWAKELTARGVVRIVRSWPFQAPTQDG